MRLGEQACSLILHPGCTHMIDEALLEILRCPRDLSPLALADSPLLERLNRAIEAGRIVNSEGTRVEQRLAGALINQSGELLYPIVQQIPALLPGEAISIRQLDDTKQEKADA